MTADRAEALAAARKLVRMLDGAPDPMRQAQQAVKLLLRVGSWPPQAETVILELNAWLATRPPPQVLKARCQAALRTLAG